MEELENASVKAEFARYCEGKGDSLSESTITQILNRERVDRSSIQRLFNAFEIPLKQSDYAMVVQNSPDSSRNNIPFTGTSSFVGREKTLDALHALLSETVSQVQPVALSGMGGIGKTELAIQYARRYASAYSAGVCWIFARRLDSGNNASIPSQIITFAQIDLGLQIPSDLLTTNDRLAYCWRHWPQGEVLLVFDDVDNYSDIFPHCLPRDIRFKVVLTIRLNLQAPVRNFPINVLEREDSLKLLALIVKDGRTDHERITNDLCEFLGDLPLAIELSGHYLAVDTSLSIAAFFQDLRKREGDRTVPSHEAFDGDAQENPAWVITARRGLEAAFNLSWERLNQSTQLIAKLIGRLDPGPIGWDMVEVMRAFLAEEYPQDGPYSPDEMTRAKNTLLRFNLLKPFDANSYRLHPLTREFFRSKTTDEEYKSYGGEKGKSK
ncbi:NB-ARC domain-containing protein [Nodosilinea nodulosa]|uniref:NB-ARC domain-containing protein n=1 Tax=Nodosilinea nodulosa TaxID=416001 RepID=UPI0018C22242|nr:NB-ARC domain-containing protein [Nodosilinea nodulosa]